MSSETDLSVLSSFLGSGLSAPEAFDRVLRTAEDRPNEATIPPLVDPAADHQGNDELAARRADVEEKHRRIIAFLDAYRLDAAVLGRADSIAWFTSGADLGRDLGSEEAAVLLYVNRTNRAVVCDNVQSARVFEEELAGLGFQLKERPWYDDPARVIAELGNNKRLATDLGGPAPWRTDADHHGDRLRALRNPLTRLERQRLRVLGRSLSLATEATCRNFTPGETEADVAGHLAHRLLREGIIPVDLRVAGEERQVQFRQPTFKSAPIHRRATIRVVGRRHGLCAAVTRTVSLDRIEPEFRDAHALAAMVDATCIYFSRPALTVAEVFQRARRIYEKFDRPHEWTLDYQGWQLGYSPREAALRPDSGLRLGTDMALGWTPSVGPARVGDTIVVDGRGFEVVTEAQNWPKIEVTVKGYSLPRPGILER